VTNEEYGVHHILLDAQTAKKTTVYVGYEPDLEQYDHEFLVADEAAECLATREFGKLFDAMIDAALPADWPERHAKHVENWRKKHQK